IERRVAVHGGGLAAGVLERVHFSVQDRAAFLDAPIVSSSEDLPLPHDDRADRDPSLAQTLLGFLNRGGEKLIAGHEARFARMPSYSQTFGPRGASRAMRTIARATSRASI